MKRKLKTVLKGMSQADLAGIMGCDQSRISQLQSSDHDVYVNYVDDEISSISYYRQILIERKVHGG